MSLFENLGSKIKTLAVVLLVIDIIASVIYGFDLIFTDKSLILEGILMLILGPIASLIASWFTYGFGEIVEKVENIDKRTRTINLQNPKAATKPVNEVKLSKPQQHVVNCPSCNRKQFASNKICWECGAKLEENQDTEKSEA